MLRKKRNIGKQGQESAAGDWTHTRVNSSPISSPGTRPATLVSLTKQLGDVELAGADPTSSLFRKLVRETIAALWKHGRYPHDKAEGTSNGSRRNRVTPSPWRNAAPAVFLPLP